MRFGVVNVLPMCVHSDVGVFKIYV